MKELMWVRLIGKEYCCDKETIRDAKGFQTAFIDASYDSNLAYKPEFVYNDNKNGQKVFDNRRWCCIVIALRLVLRL